MRDPLLDQPPVSLQETCPRMQTFVEGLATKYQVAVTVAGVQLWLALPGTRERLLIAGLSGQRISITHCIADADDQLVCDTDLVFLVDEVGWQPVELLYNDAVGEAYVQGMAATGGIQVFDEAGEISLPHFAESWARRLEQQRWLAQSQRLCV